MQMRYVKTPAGLSEIQGRTRPLSRAVRNLLLVINDSQPASYWLGSVRGISEDDIEQLAAQGLIEPARAAARPAAPRPSDVGPPTLPPVEAVANDGESDWTLTQQAIRGASYSTLYEALTSQGKALLGLVQGFRFALEVEKCGTPAELQALALALIERLRNEQGMNAVRRFGAALRSGA